jgi:P pilus assembly chaperone PapD
LLRLAVVRTAAGLSIAGLLLFAGPAKALVKQKVPYSLTVSPTRLILPVGKSHDSHVFDVSNSGTRALDVETQFSDIAQASSGALDFAPGGPFSATTWVKANPKNFHLAPGQHQRVRVTVNVPAHPEPGDHQVGMVFRVPPKTGSGNVAVSGAIGAEILIATPGKTIQEIALEGLQAPTFSNGGSVSLRLTIRNRGNVHHDYLKPHQLHAEANGKEVAFPEFSLLRDSVRTVTTVWSDPPMLCLCTITVSAADGQGHVVTTSTRVIVFPFALVGGLLLLILGLWLVLRTQRRRTQLKLDEASAGAYERGRRGLQRTASAEGSRESL